MDDLRRISDHHAMIRNIDIDKGIGGDQNIVSDMDPAYQCCIDPDLNIVSDMR